MVRLPESRSNDLNGHASAAPLSERNPYRETARINPHGFGMLGKQSRIDFLASSCVAEITG
jgi:hypothetical protein